mgnify:CR=1 FL=1
MQKLDLRGIRCPISSANLKRFLKGQSSGTVIEVISDENDARTDFPAVFKKAGATLQSFSEGAEYQTYTVVKN